MAQAGSSIDRRALLDVEEQFRSWRRSRKRGEKIPIGLWQAAVALAEQYSLDELSAALALDRERLEKRVEAALDRQSCPGSPTAATGHRVFMELGTLSTGYADECTVEVEDGAGKKLRMHFKGNGCAQAFEIARCVTNALWSAGR